MVSKYTDFFDSSSNSKENKHGGNGPSKKGISKFENRYALPDDIKRKEDIKKEFKEYLTRKDEGFNRGYVSPPFEASKVPSPYHGFNKPKLTKKNTYNYKQLKQRLTKAANDFIILESFSTLELEEAWEEKAQIDQVNHRSIKKTTRENTIRSHGLHRTLESIMNEEQSGNNNSKRNIPGYFTKK